ncbi:tyrosine-type recombinase/integrase, partial [Klebsiella pneumoniae]|uniref:tyrosine-type recombinase/integrase n=1 Tax=Klebsiella pneumoniae TaxID=573 RepID=UPI00272F1201
NDVTLKMPAFEWVHVQLHQQKGMISLSPPTLCNSATFSIPVTCHTFRHSFCMHLIQHGVPLKVVQAYAGHSRLETTETYTRVFALDVG